MEGVLRMEDDLIIDLFFQRSEQVIFELSKKYGAICQKIAFNIVHNPEDVEECINDTYLGIWNKIPPDTPNPLVAYVCKFVRNISIKKYHYNKAKKRDSSFHVSFEELEECIPAQGAGIGIAEEKELIEAIESFLKTLDKESRVMFMKRYWYAESIRDIAKSVGMTENAVTVKLHRTRKRLKKYLFICPIGINGCC